MTRTIAELAAHLRGRMPTAHRRDLGEGCRVECEACLTMTRVTYDLPNSLSGAGFSRGYFCEMCCREAVFHDWESAVDSRASLLDEVLA